MHGQSIKHGNPFAILGRIHSLRKCSRMALALCCTSICWATIPCSLLAQVARPGSDVYAVERERLIRNVLIPGGIRDQRVLDSMGKTPRHEFVPPEYVRQAYLDIAIAIGESQTISSPFIVAQMTEALQPKATDKVLEIGTGSGYQAAILSPLVKDVYTIEIVQDLGE